MENGKTFELLTKMYSEMNSKFDKMHSEMGEMHSEMKEMNKRLGNVETDVKKIGAKIDGEISPKIEVLFDGYTQSSDKLDRVENKIDKLSDKVDKHDIKIQVIEGGKSKRKIK